MLHLLQLLSQLDTSFTLKEGHKDFSQGNGLLRFTPQWLWQELYLLCHCCASRLASRQWCASLLGGLDLLWPASTGSYKNPISLIIKYGFEYSTYKIQPTTFLVYLFLIALPLQTLSLGSRPDGETETKKTSFHLATLVKVCMLMPVSDCFKAFFVRINVKMEK